MSSNFTIFIIFAFALILAFAIFSRQRPGDGIAGDPLDPAQIKIRSANMEKIMELARRQPRVTSVDVQKHLGTSAESATRYLQYLVALSKLTQINERGQSPYYKLPN